MPFVTLTKVAPLLPKGVEVMLSGDDDLFTAIEAKAGALISDLSGETAPDSPPTTDEILVLCSARIIAKLCLPRLSSISEQLREAVDADYEEAREALRGRKLSGNVGTEVRTVAESTTIDSEEGATW